MKKIAFGIVLFFLLFGCSTTKYVQVKEQVVYTYRDSIIYKDSTIIHTLEKEVYNTYTGLLDTLYMETSYSTAKAYLDTTNKLLKGEIANKHIQLPIEVKLKERIVRQDSLIYKEVPVEVEKTVIKKKVPGFFWFTFVWFVLCLVYCGIKIYGKFK